MLAVMPSIRAREHLDFVNNVSCLLGSDSEGADYREMLARWAFADDPKILSEVLMKLRPGGSQ